MKITGLKGGIDTILNVPYELVLVESAKELSEQLKANLKKKGIKYAEYNSYTKKREFEDDDTCIANPPQEIYEYQNFFILEKTNGEFILLDGFRRLLWYDAPNTPVLVKIYKEKNLDSQQILTLLVNLNHFKFFSNQNYHERGFSLLLKTVFDVDITTFRTTFDAYLSSNETKNSYGSYGRLTGQHKNEEIKQRIIGKHFISDMKFLEKLNASKYLCDQYMGALVYEERQKTDTEFDVATFIKLADEHKVLQDLTVKYEKIGTDHSAKSQEVVNKIIEIYRNLFILMAGGEVGKSFAEQQQECKDLVAQLKKDKTLVKLTGAQEIYKIERIISEMINKGEKLEFVCVLHPNEKSELSDWDKRHTPNWKKFILPYGINNDIKFLNLTDKHLGMGMKEMQFGLVIDGTECLIRHNYGGYNSYGKKYTRLDMPMGCPNYDIDLFVKMQVEKPAKSKEPRQLKKFSYHPQGRKERTMLFVLAWTNKEAMELFEKAGHRINAKYLNDFVGKSWGKDGEEFLKDVDQTQPCIYKVRLTEFGSHIEKTINPEKIA